MLDDPHISKLSEAAVERRDCFNPRSQVMSPTGLVTPTLVLPQAGLSVDLVCADVDEAPDGSCFPARLKQHMSAVCVVHGEGQRVSKRVVDVGLHGGKQSVVCSAWAQHGSMAVSEGTHLRRVVHDRVDPFRGKHEAQQVHRLDVSLHKLRMHDG